MQLNPYSRTSRTGFKRKYLIWTLTIFFNGILNVFEKILYFNKSRFENSGKNDFAFIISTYDPRLLTFTIPLVKNLKYPNL